MVPGLAHVILHVGFCSAIARLKPDAAVALHVRLSDRTGRTTLDRTFRVDRGDGSEAIVEFDSAQGTFRLDAAAPRFGCSVTDYVALMPDHTRSVAEQLESSPPSPQMPVLLYGDAPQTMLYANPTYVFFDKSAVACGKPIAAPITTHVNVENDQDSYYAWLYNDDATRQPDTEVLALRLQTPTHQHHYVRIPLPFPVPRSLWPGSIHLDVSEGMIDELATEPVDTLLCPKMWKTSAG
jgi:hypothetical protein